MITVVETPTFLKDVKRAGLSEDKHRELVNFLATYPEAGVMMEGTGGVRKVRLRFELKALMPQIVEAYMARKK
ncbi:MAG: hypothetical protein Q7J24_15040 [Desulfomicrobium sp.]|nr:hypothetical protein [Desulfomicrobium sp.]MDP3429093.1 hypothetical protein [Desulfomicrobium sp.]